MRQLPGIAFETVPPPLPDTLPRMDIAAFVGFAQAGPPDVPVAVEDSARFRDLFGADVALAWDAEDKRPQYGVLGTAVEAFFDNGGQRCHVVRVARDPYTHRFDLPGLASTGGTLPNPTRARARSPGAWAQVLRAGTTLEPTPLALLPAPAADNPALDIDASGAAQEVRIDVAAAPGTLTAGDLLEIAFLPADLLLYVTVSRVALIDRGLRATVAPTPGEINWQWARETAGSPPAANGSQRSAPLALLDEASGLSAHAGWLALAPAGRAVRLRRLTFEINVWRDQRLLSRIGQLAFCPRHPRFFGNLPSDEALFALPLHPRADQRDAEYQALRLEASGERSPLAAGSGRRFPLAGPAEVRRDVQPPLYLPDAMALTRSFAHAAPPLPLAPTEPLAQDGLAGLAPALFLDERLQDYSGASLLRSAEQMHNRAREWEERPRGQPPQRLRGLHALLPVQEVTLVAVPDAAQRPWSTDPIPVPAVLPGPWLHPVAGADTAGRLHLSWDAVAEATGYRLEWDETPDFAAAVPAFEGDATSARFAPPASCAQALCFRVRAQRHGEPSPWSNTRVHHTYPGEFTPCARQHLSELLLSATEGSPPPAETSLAWSAQPPGTVFEPGTRFRVEVADDALFQSARAVSETTATTYTLPAVRTGLSYYRVHTLGEGAPGPVSNTLAFGPSGAGRPLLQPLAATFDDTLLLAVQRTLLRFCAARGDVLALLCVPRHFGAPQLLDYLAALAPDDSASELSLDSTRRGRMPLTTGETPALSYGALYHPWTARTPAADGVGRDPEFVPPDGAAAGQLARTALLRGAWVASANQPLSGVLALDPALTDGQRRALTELQINLVCRDPRGFALINDETLSRTADTRPVSVRRLLILLKRLALREGAAYVFEPLTSDFPDRVRHRFQRLLSNLHLRGAFQGENAQDAFGVVVDASINPPRSLDLGRFVVELRVAPSRPLAFLRVRLIQSGPQELAVGEL